MKTPIIRKLLILSLVLVLSLFLDDCQKEIDPFINSYNQDLSEKKHYIAIEGTEHFFFLPPLAPMPSPTGTFVGNLAPVVQICKWTGTGCELPPIAEFTTTTGKVSERVRVVPEDELYIVNWNTKRFGLNLTGTYRIHVLLRIEEKVSIEIELGHLDVNLKGDSRTIPIKFRIEEGYSPIVELTALERAKISPVLLMQFLSQEVVEPVEALVNVFDDQITLPELTGVEILRDYRPILAQVFARISNPETLASLVQLNNIAYVYENRKWKLTSYAWQESIGQPSVQDIGYAGAGTAIVLGDDGGKTIGVKHDLAYGDIIDLSVPVFGCTDVGTPTGCRIVYEENLVPQDAWGDNHATYVARRVVETAPEADIIAWDIVVTGEVEGWMLSEAIWWTLQHKDEYNIVAFNMSFANDASCSDCLFGAEVYSTEDCPKGDDWNFQRLLEAGIMPIAGSGNNGYWQLNEEHAFEGISHPACSPYVVSVGGTTSQGEIWGEGTRGPNLDLLAPAEQENGPPGTSLSAPTVAGAWAIIRSALPNLSNEEILELLKSTGTPIFDASSGLTFPLIQIDKALASQGLPICYSNLPDPILTFTGTEEFVDDSGNECIRYNFAVSNYTSFPDELFAAAPGLEPCDGIPNASRTRVDIFNNNDEKINGFCDFNEASDLNGVWFSTYVGETPPSIVYITLTDRRCVDVYKSQMISTVGDSFIAFEKLQTQTVLSDGTVSSSTGLIERTYRVRAKITLLQGAQWGPEGPAVSVVYINQENGNEQFAKAMLVSGSTTEFYFDLPGSENLGICGSLFYRWSVVYDVVNAETGVYLGEAYFEMPTKYYSGNTLVQAMCQTPENPWGF